MYAGIIYLEHIENQKINSYSAISLIPFFNFIIWHR